jgi:hypothetical protein
MATDKAQGGFSNRIIMRLLLLNDTLVKFLSSKSSPDAYKMKLNYI